MHFPKNLRLALVAALTLASPLARAGDVSPEVVRAVRRGDARIPVVVTLRAVEGRRAATSAELATSGLAVRRRLSSAPVVAGDASAAGIAALAARPDVLHVGFDRLVRPTGQVGTAQIGADRLLAIGVTGLGRSVGIVDSGLDLQHPDLKPPAGTAWPGVNVADGTDDLTDCSGHGTEVAGVLAGPQGIAPEAGLVVLKVFSSRDGCSTARASDVLAAVDWAVAHAPGSDLEAINLSLADDAPQKGFCDADDPAGVAVFASARDAGLVVVAAAGNDGKTDGLPWPACLSSVASVGMVYSLSNGPVQWGGAAGCSDLVTGPDVIPCASNTGSALALLAPGRRLDDDGRRRRPHVPLLRHLRRGAGGDGRASPRAPGAAARGPDARDRSPPRDGCPRARHANRPRDAARSTSPPRSGPPRRSRAGARVPRSRTARPKGSRAARRSRRSSATSRPCSSRSRSTIPTPRSSSSRSPRRTARASPS